MVHLALTLTLTLTRTRTRTRTLTLARLPAAAWKEASAAAAHNQRHLACGGLRKVMGAHAIEAVRLAWDISRLLE